MENKTVLITGTTSGIGYELSKIFAVNGYDLVLVSRDAKKLKAQKNFLKKEHQTRVYIIAKDLSQPSAAEDIHKEVASQGIKIDILVNNAGFNESGLFIETNIDKELEMIQVHTTFLTKLTKLLVLKMIEQGYGKILNMGSTGSFSPVPYDAVYAATKAYILSFSSALRAELAGTGVTVSTLCPGATRTEFAKKAGIENTQLFKRFVMNPKVVAKIAYKRFMKNKRVIIPGLYNKILVFLMPFTPAKIADKLTIMLLRND